VNGFVVGCMLTPPGEPFTHPPELARELGDYEIDLAAPRGLKRDDADYRARGLPYLEGLLRQTRQRTAATRMLMGRAWDLLCVVYYAPDRIQHYFWPELAGGDGDPDVRRALDANYAALDEAIGSLVAAAGPATTVVLVSDHGFGSKPERAFHLNRWLAQHGFLHERPFWRLRRRLVRRVVSASHRGLYDTPDRMVDMARTRAWAQTLEPGTAGIWVNVVGRYPLGCVPQGRAYEAVREDIIAGLEGVMDDRGRRVFTQVRRREETYRGPYVIEAPDIVAVCSARFGVIYESVRRDLRARSLFGPFQELGFTGTHDGAGIYLFAGPEVRAAGQHAEYPIESIAPTALHLLGLPVPRGMEGRIFSSLMDPDFLRRHPPVMSDEAEDEAGSAPGWKSAEDEARIAAHLRSLGYVE
jgi:predicted AlkP superfamily phosphohydrolase/phosphomutase